MLIKSYHKLFRYNNLKPLLGTNETAPIKKKSPKQATQSLVKHLKK